ncbi:ribbon-helix-helix domain-containing protein [Cryobacterium flavum]|uniref:Ribbon-helix-helix domain-containing protein n=1 Tax=Cryobacterium flavum TaxID=1424659 RepID=A0ABY2I328_9MICO|nr:ribbon-helix-helix domain-containing protein [Cryobacterium flavum]
MLRFRVPEEDRSALRKLTESTHRKQSDLLREGLALLLEHYSGAPASIELEPPSATAGQFVVELSSQELALLRGLTRRIDTQAHVL